MYDSQQECFTILETLSHLLELVISSTSENFYFGSMTTRFGRVYTATTDKGVVNKSRIIGLQALDSQPFIDIDDAHNGSQDEVFRFPLNNAETPPCTFYHQRIHLQHFLRVTEKKKIQATNRNEFDMIEENTSGAGLQVAQKKKKGIYGPRWREKEKLGLPGMQARRVISSQADLMSRPGHRVLSQNAHLGMCFKSTLQHLELILHLKPHSSVNLVLSL
ncbi:uncharacterized protein EV420DRAFT_1693679 [Desarmillaria tabescens]|uniref:Uncharacterized protein n=1 Tax=Armillaria tabescens TaxID=1929756 RepID=A0AA39N374_ARMTA|nr:uncharacterized protein EV420DRAFT_1693679 [Desarmillaria tabescens]KAK0455555.1 hypothetical protein EV420DRAFT_1693679 [Desarmillaria tabescens]